MTGGRQVDLPTRVTLQSGAVIAAHTLVWGTDLQGNRLIPSLGPDCKGKPNRGRPELVPDHPEVYAVGDSAAITDAKTNQVIPQSDRSRCSPASTPTRRSRVAWPARSRSRSPQGQGHYGDDRASGGRRRWAAAR
jgi:hypothetical protein